MKVYRILEVDDREALGALRRFLHAWWGLVGFDALLAPVETCEIPGIASRVIEDQRELEVVDPFAPLMPINSAGLLNQLIANKPGQIIGALLRPCELRTFFELQKRQTRPAPAERLVLIGVDCPGTYPLDDYQSLVQSRSAQTVRRETMQNAAAGGLRAQPIRTACQMCEKPAPGGVDLTIGTIGVATDQFLLLISNDERTDAVLRLAEITDGMATEYQASHSETLVGAMADMRLGMHRKLTENLPGAYRFDDLGSFFAWLSGCSLCGKCLEACPLYELEFQGVVSRGGGLREKALLGELVHLGRWLASCSWCGMCAENCLQQVPFSLMISSLSRRIRQEIGYTPGDPAQALPWSQTKSIRGKYVVSHPNS